MASITQDPPIQVTLTGFNALHYSHLEESFRSVALACITAYNVRFEPAAIAKLFTLIEDGMIEIKKKKHETTFEKISEAQGNLVNFIYQIYAEATERKLTSVDDALIQDVITTRMVQFCPVYPFS